MPEEALLGATELADLVRRGEIAPAELVADAIARIEKLNLALNAVIHPLFDKALDQAADPPDGPFRGVPIAIKDLVCTTAGDPYHCGMRFLRDAGWTAREDSYTAAKLRAAGFMIVGRTNTPELGLMPTTEPEAYGPTRNPWNPEHSTGGSSGGSAAAVAAGMVPVAHATDGGGSIRIPASECGLVGLKPSRGRVPGDPRHGPTGGIFGVEHVLTRSVRDSAAILDVLAETRPGTYAERVGEDPGRLRIGFTQTAPGGLITVHPDCVTAVEEVATLLSSLGHAVEESRPAPLDEIEHIIHFGALTGGDAVSLLEWWSERIGREIGPGDVEPNTWMIAEMGRQISDEHLQTSIAWLEDYTRRVLGWWAEGFDLLVTPTIPEPPPKLGDLTGTPDDPLAGGIRGGVIAAFTPQFNTTGQPAISLPLFWNDAGLPIGVQLVAGPGREDLLIRVASQLERAAPWSNRRPPLNAAP